MVLRFSWPIGSEAMVEETVTKKGTTAVERYRLRLLPVAGDTAGLQDVVVDELKFVSVNGNAIDTPEERAAMAQAEQMASIIPRLRIDRSGAVVAILGIDDMLAGVVATRPEHERAGFEKVMMSPNMRTIAGTAASKVWGTWVTGLNGFSAAPDEEMVGTTTVAGPDGPLEQRTAYLLHVVDDRVTVSTATHTPPAVARALLLPTFEAILAGAGPEMKTMLDKMEFDIESSSMSELDPKTMRPFRIQTRQVMRGGEPGKLQERIETHDYVFTWKN